MKTPPRWTLVLALALMHADSGAGEDDGFESLFDGKSLAGWDGDLAFWSVEDGCITGKAGGDHPLAANTFLIRAGDWSDFELHFEYRIHGGNSGCQYRAQRAGGFAVSGYQADLEAGPDWTGMLYEEGPGSRGIMAKRGEMVEFGKDGTRRAIGSVGGFEELQKLVKADDWNEYVVIARGPRLTHLVNGRVTCDVIDESPRAHASGLLALQLHAGFDMKVQYRAIRIRRLDSAAPATAAKPTKREPEWIWSGAEGKAGEVVAFRRSFEVTSPVSRATLMVRCDNHHVTWLNGVEVARGDDWFQPDVVDVTKALKQGANLIAVQGRNEADASAAALCARLTIVATDGTKTEVVTDGEWRCAPGDPENFASSVLDDSKWAKAYSHGANAQPWIAFGDAAGNSAEPPEATPASRLRVPEGFEVTRLYSVKKSEGSWVSMTFDPQGRIVVSPQYGGLLRVTLDAHGGEPKVERLDLPFAGAQGLLFAFDSLYVNVNDDASAKGGLWRCFDRDGDGKFEETKRLRAYGPGGEHGAHGVVEGPDGLLYVCLGNHVEQGVLAGIADSPLRDYAEDMALSREWDPNGHAVGIVAPGTMIMRTDPDGKEWQLFAGGMRNPYDLAFNEDGELFTYDSDMEWDIGLPWYKPTRVYHLVSGGEYGWRSGSGNWPTWFPDALPSVADVGLGSPVGVAFGTRSAFPEPWRSAFFIGDWAYGRILAVNLREDGSSYRGETVEFASGTPMNVTDFEFGPDGAMYFLTGGRGTQSGLYRVAWTGGEKAGAAPAHTDAARAARELRHRLEEFHGRVDAKALDACWPHLDSADRFVRAAARVAIEAQPFADWRQRALDESRPVASLEALLALARVAQGTTSAIVEKLGATALAARSRDQKLAELRILEIALCRQPAPDAATRERILARWDASFPSNDFDLDRATFAVLNVLRAPGRFDRGVALLGQAKDEATQIFWGFSLRDVRDDGSAESRAAFLRWLEQAKSFQGGHSLNGYVQLIATATLKDSRPAPSLAAPAPEAAPAAPAAPDRWTLDELAPKLAGADSGRSFNRGKAAFERVLCAKCHRVGTEGGSVGPDLTGARSRFSRRDLVETIVDPSKVISDQYADARIALKDGSVVVGRIVGEDPYSLFVSVNPLDPSRVTVGKRDIAKKSTSKVSPMPAHLLEPLTLDEILDLIAYVESGGDGRARAFGR